MLRMFVEEPSHSTDAREKREPAPHPVPVFHRFPLERREVIHQRVCLFRLSLLVIPQC
jgi:hypothetical protein